MTRSVIMAGSKLELEKRWCMFTMAQTFVQQVILDFGLLHSILMICFIG